MKNPIEQIEGVRIISMVVPSVNGCWSKHIVLSTKEYNKLRKASNINESNLNYFALFCDSTIYHEIQKTGYGGLSREQFDLLIKNKYNSIYQKGARNKPLKMIK